MAYVFPKVGGKLPQGKHDTLPRRLWKYFVPFRVEILQWVVKRFWWSGNSTANVFPKVGGKLPPMETRPLEQQRLWKTFVHFWLAICVPGLDSFLKSKVVFFCCCKFWLRSPRFWPTWRPCTRSAPTWWPTARWRRCSACWNCGRRRCSDRPKSPPASASSKNPPSPSPGKKEKVIDRVRLVRRQSKIHLFMPGHTEFYLVFSSFNGLLSGFTEFYRVLPRFSWFYLVWPSFTWFSNVVEKDDQVLSMKIAGAVPITFHDGDVNGIVMDRVVATGCADRRTRPARSSTCAASNDWPSWCAILASATTRTASSSPAWYVRRHLGPVLT